MVLLYISIFKRSANTILTTSKKQATFEPGYYDEFTVFSEIPVTGSVTYRHHVHSILSTEEYVETYNTTLTTDGPADNYRSSEEGGCFTQIVYGTKKCRAGISDIYDAGYNSGGDTPNFKYIKYNCGHVSVSDGGWSGTCPQTVSDYSVVLGYARTCGITRSQITSAIIAY